MPRVAQIVYGTARRDIRRVIVTDSWARLRPHPLDEGEDCIITDPAHVLVDGGLNLPGCYALVEAKRGTPSKGARR